MADREVFQQGSPRTPDAVGLIKPVKKLFTEAGVKLGDVDLAEVQIRLGKFQNADKVHHIRAPEQPELQLILFALLDRLVKIESLIATNRINGKHLSEELTDLANSAVRSNVAKKLDEAVNKLFVWAADESRDALAVQGVVSDDDFKLANQFQSSIESLGLIIASIESPATHYVDPRIGPLQEYLRKSKLAGAFETRVTLDTVESEGSEVSVTYPEEKLLRTPVQKTPFVLRAFGSAGFNATLNALMFLTVSQERESLTIDTVGLSELTISGWTISRWDRLYKVDFSKLVDNPTGTNIMETKNRRWGRPKNPDLGAL